MTGYDETTRSAAARTSTVLIYDKAKGNVLHMHEVITLEGGTAPTEAEATARALELARAGANFFGRKPAAKLAALTLREAIAPMAGARRVNPKSGLLVPAKTSRKPRAK